VDACPLLESLRLSALRPLDMRQVAHMQQAEAPAASDEDRMREREGAARDREAIRAHAIANGLPLPPSPPPPSSPSLSEWPEAAALQDDESAAAAPSARTSAHANPSLAPLISSLARLPLLREVDLSCNDALHDRNLLTWANAMGDGSAATAETQQQGAMGAALREINLSGCVHVSTAGVSVLLDAPLSQPGCILPSVPASSVPSPHSSPPLLLADECPFVEVDELPFEWRHLVQASGAFTL
jgi:hypothetical protein